MKRIYCILFLLCISVTPIFSQTWLWAKGEINGSQNSAVELQGITTDASGNIYEAGSYRDTAIFESDTLKYGYSNGNVCLVKYDPNGNLLWARKSTIINTATDDGGANSVCTDNLGNVYIGGTFEGNIIFGLDTLTKGNNGFLVKYDANGNELWAKPFSDYVTSITADPANNIYLTFESSSTLIKCNSSGNTLWTKSPSSPTSGGNSVATNNIGNVFIAGLFETSLSIGGDTLKSPGWYTDAFIAKFDSSGNILWLRNGILPSTYNYSNGLSVASDKSGNAYMTGIFYDTIVFGSYVFTNGTSQGNVFLTKYDSKGNVVWAEDAQLIGAVGSDIGMGYSVCTDQSENIYLCGTFEDTMTMGGGTLTVPYKASWAGDNPSFIYKFDSSGHALCSTAVNNDNDDYNGVIADPLGDNVYFGGSAVYTNNCTFGSIVFNGGGYRYAFLSKLTCSGPTITNEVSENNLVKLFPNPTNGSFNVFVQDISNKPQLVVYNMMGDMVYESALTLDNTHISFENNSAGIYLYRVVSEQGELISRGKLIIE